MRGDYLLPFFKSSTALLVIRRKYVAQIFEILRPSCELDANLYMLLGVGLHGWGVAIAFMFITGAWRYISYSWSCSDICSTSYAQPLNICKGDASNYEWWRWPRGPSNRALISSLYVNLNVFFSVTLLGERHAIAMKKCFWDILRKLEKNRFFHFYGVIDEHKRRLSKFRM